MTEAQEDCINRIVGGLLLRADIDDLREEIALLEGLPASSSRDAALANVRYDLEDLLFFAEGELRAESSVETV